MSSTITIYQNQITRLTAQIASYQTTLTSLQAEVLTGANITALVTSRISQVQTKIANLNSQITMFQGLITSLQAGWGANQTYVTDIQTLFPGTYDGMLNRLQTLDPATITAFFTAYSQATTTCQKQCVCDMQNSPMA